jgi:hypothetical protein
VQSKLLCDKVTSLSNHVRVTFETNCLVIFAAARGI